jgi:hydroxyethylthiazole kinase
MAALGDAAALGAAVDAVRSAGPLTHCIANYVSMDLMANALLAAGASPAMIHAEEEAAAFVGVCAAVGGALSVNIGTLSAPWVRSMLAAAAAANASGVPWVLDPVGCGATPYRTGVAAELARLKPTAVRGNASEILSLAAQVAAPAEGGGASGGKGVDSTRGSGEALAAARALAGVTGGVVVVSGAVDYVVGPSATLAVTSGLPLLQRITATGCTLSSLVAAFLAVRSKGAGEAETMNAAAAACAFFGAAAEAGAAASAGRPLGPGTLRVALLDALHLTTGAHVAATARVEVL